VKICTKCHIKMSLLSFSKKTGSIDGLRSNCKGCDRAYRLTNKVKITEYMRSRIATRRGIYWRDIEKSRDYKRNYAEKNKEKLTESNRVWARNNPEKKNANRMKYLSDKRMATPSKLTLEMLGQIHLVYKLAISRSIETGVQHHVDHIIPLCGVLVCGLHVPWNLQVLTAKENQTKGNKIEGVYNGRK